MNIEFLSLWQILKSKFYFKQSSYALLQSLKLIVMYLTVKVAYDISTGKVITYILTVKEIKMTVKVITDILTVKVKQ